MAAQTMLHDEIRRRDEEFIQAFNRGDTNAMIQLYDDQCAFMPVNMEPIHDKKKIQEFFQQTIDGGMKTLTLNTDDVQGSGEWAYERGNFIFNKGQDSSSKGVFVVVWHKVDGKWKIHVDCFHPSA